MKPILLFIATSLLQTVSFGQGDIDHIKNQAYMKNAGKIDCSDEDAQTTATGRICANLAFQKSDSLLIVVYKKLLDRQETDSAKMYIINLQKEWRSFRDKHCNIVWEQHRGGSMQGTVYLGCLTELTDNRRKELESLLAE